MNMTIRKLFCLLLASGILISLLPSALAESDGSANGESLIDTAYLDGWIEGYLRDKGITHNWQDFSVGFCYTATGDCWFYNADVFMYSASMYKAPVSMLMAEKEAAGEITQSSDILGYKLDYLESSALIYSNNDSGHAMVSYLGGSYSGKCSDQAIAYTDLDRSYFPPDFFDYSYYSARFMTQVMTTLWEGGEERFPHVIEYLKQAQPNEYMNITLKDRWEVAQKYGAYVERNGRDNNHDAAIIYTPNPIVVVVMTRDVGEYQDRISEVALFLAKYALTLDEKLAEREKLQAEAEAAALLPAPAEPMQDALASDDTEAMPAEALAAPSMRPTEMQPPAEEPVSMTGLAQPESALPDRTPTFYVLLACGGVLVLLLAVSLFGHRRGRRRRR